MSDASAIHWLALSLKPDAVNVAVSDPHGACAPMVAPSSSVCSAICLLERVLVPSFNMVAVMSARPGTSAGSFSAPAPRMVNRAVTSGKR